MSQRPVPRSFPRPRRSALLPLSAFAASVLLAGCEAMTPSGVAPPPLEGTAWVLSALPARATDGAGGDRPATLRFEGGQASGSDGCNRFAGPYTRQGEQLSFTARLASTMMACPPEVESRAAAFRQALGDARRYRVADGRLALLGSDGAVLATLAPQPQSIAGTAWRVTAVHDGRGGVASVRAGTAPTLAFGADGRLSGSAGCNRFNARYEAAPGRIRITAPATTRMMCPPEVMAQEQALLKALEAASTARLEAGRLELRGERGELLVAADADAGR